MSLSTKSHQLLPGKTSDLHLLHQAVNSIDKRNVSCILSPGRVLRKTNDMFSKRFKYGSEWRGKAAELP